MEGWMYAFLAVLAWGLEAIIIRGAGDEVDPLTGTGIGCIAAGVMYFAFLAATGRLTQDVFTRSSYYYGLAGIVSFAIGHFLYYTAINKSGVALSTSLVATYPLLTVVLAAVLYGEPLTIKSGLGTLLIVVGGIILLI